MNKHYKHLSTTLVPNEDGEEKVEIHLYQVDPDENTFLWHLMGYEKDLEGYIEKLSGQGYDEDYIEDIIEYESVEYAVTSALKLFEEPEYAVQPGGIYHRYEVYLMWGVVAVVETAALNV